MSAANVALENVRNSKTHFMPVLGYDVHAGFYGANLNRIERVYDIKSKYPEVQDLTWIRNFVKVRTIEISSKKARNCGHGGE